MDVVGCNRPDMATHRVIFCGYRVPVLRQVKWQSFSDKHGTLQTHAKISDCGKWKIAKYQMKAGFRYLLWKKAGKGWESVGEAMDTFNEAEGQIDGMGQSKRQVAARQN